MESHRLNRFAFELAELADHIIKKWARGSLRAKTVMEG